MSQFIEMFGNPLSSVQRYPLKKLGDCCEVNPRRPNLTLKDTDIVSFIPMPSVSENGYLQDVADEEYGKVKKGFTYFENNDVLFAKITPCMENGKGAIAEGLMNNIGMGSTEFHVLRPIEGVSSPYWLLALTRLPIFRERASKNMTGTGGQKRVPAKYLENFMVGLPPIEEQNRFENIYKQSDKSGFDGLKSQFIEMFGGIDKTSCTKQLKDYATFRGGFAFKSEQFKQNDVPIIRISNISGNTVEVDYNICYELDFWNKNPLYRVEKNDILIAMSGATTGKSGIYRSNRPALLNQRVASVRPKPNIALTSFIFMALQLDGMYKIIQDTAQGGAQPNISGKQIESLPMPSSTYEGQIYFDTIYNQADKSGSVWQYRIAC